jgi:hypothetical protein
MKRRFGFLLCLAVLACCPADSAGIALRVPGADVRVQFESGNYHLPKDVYIAWLQTAADAVRAYYRQFPVPKLLIKVRSQPGDDVGFATTACEHGQAVIEIPIGESMSGKMLKESWVAAHEMTHLAFPLVMRNRRWVAEGQATYIEPLARLQIHDLSAESVWGDLSTHLSSGLPRADDSGLNSSHSIRRTYWGGAFFCLLADLEIRRQTKCRLGLQDAVAAIDKKGGNVTSDWSVERAFQVGDQAVGLTVLEDLDAKMCDAPYTVDLASIWKQLGVAKADGVVRFDDTAPLASVRHAIEAGHP